MSILPFFTIVLREFVNKLLARSWHCWWGMTFLDQALVRGNRSCKHISCRRARNFTNRLKIHFLKFYLEIINSDHLLLVISSPR